MGKSNFKASLFCRAAILLGKNYFLIVEILIIVHLEICLSVMESSLLLNYEYDANRLQDNKEGQTHNIIFVFLQ